MADISNIIFIKGSKQSIVDFINRGLEGSRVKKRVSDSMSGAEIVNRLNDHGYPFSMTSYIPMPRTYLTYDTTNTVKDFYSWYVEGMGPYDITVDAYGFDNEEYEVWYQFNGQTDELIKKNPWKDRNYKKYRKEFEKAAAEEDEGYQEYFAVGKAMTGYVKDFLKELDESFLENKHK